MENPGLLFGEVDQFRSSFKRLFEQRRIGGSDCDDRPQRHHAEDIGDNLCAGGFQGDSSDRYL